MERPAEHLVRTPHGSLRVHCWEPHGGGDDVVTFVTVHPWASLGGGEHNTVGYGQALSTRGYRVLTFDLRSSSMVWGVLSGQKSEVNQVVAVCDWAERTFGGTLYLLGSSAGAPVAGTALDRTNAAGLVAIGYTFGRLSAIAFWQHYAACLRSTKPKLFLMGEHDEFTSPAQLRARVASAAGDRNQLTIFDGVGHFEMEAPEYDELLCARIAQWMQASSVASSQAPAGHNEGTGT
jgi:pimeloyl-ACP methyl ester carboxylesterase